MQTFTLEQSDGSSEYYAQHGYAVFAGLIPRPLCEGFLTEYEREKGNRFFIFPTQSTYDALPFLPNREGYIPESVENPTFMSLRPKFARAARTCLLNDRMAQGLAAIDGSGRHVLWQSMFFDKSTGTPIHQDSLYLDTQPRGKLIGAWVALEDIDPLSGPFLVYPGTHKVAPYTDEHISTYGSIHRYCQQAIDRSGIAPIEMVIKKGDVVFWHPSLIHGAADNRDSSFSRKSLTAHFYPAECFTIYDRDTRTPTRPVTPAFDLHRRSFVTYHLGAYKRWAVRKLKGQAALSSRQMKAAAQQE